LRRPSSAPGIHLGVSAEDGVLSVWGTTRTLPPFSMVLEVAAPGLIVVKQHRGGEHLKFANIAVLESDQVKIVDEGASSLPDCPSLLTSLLGFDTPGRGATRSTCWSARRLDARPQARRLAPRRPGRGGSLARVDRVADSVRARSAVLAAAELSAAGRSNGTVLGGRARTGGRRRRRPDRRRRRHDHHRSLRSARFGAKITRRRGSPPVEQTTVTEPIEGGTADIVHPSSLGGTRHLSAAQFAHDSQDAIALVASQDGHFTVFAWSPCERMVHAHRVEALLL
jgi:hypothetical protein